MGAKSKEITPDEWQKLKAKKFNNREEVAAFTGYSDRVASQILFAINNQEVISGKKMLPYKEITGGEVNANKKTSEIHWRDLSNYMKHKQDVNRKASYTQDFANIHVKTDKPICLLNLCDLHFGANGVDYEILEKMTDEIINTEGLYVVLTGDILETAIVMRNVKEMVNQLEPELQIAFLSSWLDDIKDKVLWATWDNHTAAREEKLTGFSVYKRIIGSDKQIIYQNGIGYVDLKVGEMTYKFVTSHKFNGRSMLNALHGQQRHMRFEALDREIAMSGDSHKVGFAWYYDGDRERLAINGGTLHVNSGYAKRYFSLFTIPDFPCVVLYPNEKLFIPFKNLKAWKRS